METRSAGALRGELNQRALALARAKGRLHAVSDGPEPSVLFGPDDAGEHGNFNAAAYRCICAEPAWAARLQKAHTASRRMRLRSDWDWKELDCACSSDALLMNVFCHPRVMRSAELCGMLGVERNERPQFGYRPGVPLVSGRVDQTEIDMRLGGLLVEAKLTESDFAPAAMRKVRRYRDLDAVFGEGGMADAWAAGAEVVRCYQVIRGVLAAYATGGSYCLLSDARRPELQEAWYCVLSAVRSAELRCRVKLLTWQELAAYLPRTLRGFLDEKYGIRAARG